ncbi:toxin-antitoxin system YwqK family antitoxin [Flavobacterium sp. W22_SRS_FP1]|uniref:toxin-antitoxin system YwqK family antitoxin n=1 Tax=Flavobacterium sp. W22_SRS_FP1 TaxID=3240276 RepID=UPI003F91975F
MKSIFLILILFFNISGKAQTEKVYYNSNWDLTNSNDYEYYLEIDKSNNKNEFKTFYKSGEVKSTFYCSEINTEEISKSKFYSKYIEYAKDGTSLCEGEFENGTKIGKWLYYYDSKKIKFEINYFNDKQNGNTSTYFENGNLKSVGDYSDGNKTGKWVYYDDNANKSYEETYKEGKLNGNYISYFDNKKIFQKGIFTDGLKKSNLLTNYNDGGIKTIVEYNKDNRNPICHECNECKNCKIVLTNFIEIDYLTNKVFTYGRNYFPNVLTSYQEMDIVSGVYAIENEKFFHTGLISDFKGKLISTSVFVSPLFDAIYISGILVLILVLILLVYLYRNKLKETIIPFKGIIYNQKKNMFFYKRKPILLFDDQEKKLLIYLLEHLNQYLSLNELNQLFENKPETGTYAATIKRRELIINSFLFKVSKLTGIDENELLIERKNATDKRIKDIWLLPNLLEIK